MDSSTRQEEPEEIPKTVASPLSGAQVKPFRADRPVTALVIENSPDARPQSSLHQAGIVFESIAEAGITRFLAFYQDQTPQIIGPIRSLRPYFVDWIATFDASIAHVGGSAQALREAKQLGLKDIDQFFNAGSYWRATDRFAPHNVYSSFKLLDDLNESKGFTESDFEPFMRTEDRDTRTPIATQINVGISSFTYNSSYTYHAPSNTYKRSQGGAAHRDRESNKQLAPSTIMVIRVPSTIEADGRYQYDLVGSGKFTAFRDGRVFAGTWSKDSRKSQFEFTTKQGSDFLFSPGQAWVVALEPGKSLSWKK